MRYRLSKNFVYKDYGDIRIYYKLGGANEEFCNIEGSGKVIMDFINSRDVVCLEEILQFLKQNMTGIEEGVENDIKEFLSLMVKQEVVEEVC